MVAAFTLARYGPANRSAAFKNMAALCSQLVAACGVGKVDGKTAGRRVNRRELPISEDPFENWVGRVTKATSASKG